jgi:hypothetical protein
VANKLILATAFYLPGLLIRLIGFGKSEYRGYANKVQAITGGGMISLWHCLFMTVSRILAA